MLNESSFTLRVWTPQINTALEEIVVPIVVPRPGPGLSRYPANRAEARHRPERAHVSRRGPPRLAFPIAPLRREWGGPPRPRSPEGWPEEWTW